MEMKVKNATGNEDGPADWRVYAIGRRERMNYENEIALRSTQCFATKSSRTYFLGERIRSA
jgi:hypothetical protein